MDQDLERDLSVMERRFVWFIALLGGVFIVERFLLGEPAAWHPLLIASGLLGGLCVVLLWRWLGGRDLALPRGRLPALARLGWVLGGFFLAALLGLAVQFLPALLLDAPWDPGSQSVVADLGVELPPPWRQLSESTKDMAWCSVFALLVWCVLQRLRQREGFTHHVMLWVTFGLLVIASALIPFVVVQVAKHQHNTVYAWHVGVQTWILFAALAVLLGLYARSREIQLLSAHEDIGSLLLKHFSMGLGYRTEYADAPPDHLDALGTLVLDVAPAPRVIVDACGGKGAFAEWLVDHNQQGVQAADYLMLEYRPDAAAAATRRLDRLAAEHQLEGRWIAVSCNVVMDPFPRALLVGKADLVVLNQSVQFFKPARGAGRQPASEHEVLFANIRSILSVDGCFLLVDEFPQQAPLPGEEHNEDNARRMRERANVFMPMHPVRESDIVRWAEQAGLERVARATLDLRALNPSRTGYHPPITGLLFRLPDGTHPGPRPRAGSPAEWEMA